jgi:hypothetical protein
MIIWGWLWFLKYALCAFLTTLGLLSLVRLGQRYHFWDAIASGWARFTLVCTAKGCHECESVDGKSPIVIGNDVEYEDWASSPFSSVSGGSREPARKHPCALCACMLQFGTPSEFHSVSSNIKALFRSRSDLKTLWSSITSDNSFVNPKSPQTNGDHAICAVLA